MLFPKIGKILDINFESHFCNLFEDEDKIQIRRVCNLDSFDMYLNLQIPNILHKTSLIDGLINHCTDYQYVDEVFKNISLPNEIQYNSPKIKIFFDELKSQFGKIKPDGYSNIFNGIFFQLQQFAKNL